jgi:NitT/TauT family transport system substrate-binding protein
MRRLVTLFIRGLLAGLISAMSAGGGAEEIVVSNYAVSANGMPFGVALARGYCRTRTQHRRPHFVGRGRDHAAQHADRGGVPYEMNPASSRRSGGRTSRLSAATFTVAEFVWAVKPDSPIKTIKDLKGKRWATPTHAPRAGRWGT